MSFTDGRKPERILVVEDEQIVALDIRLHLEQFGYTVAAIHAEAETALAYLADNRENLPDLVIMDIHLQGEMDGVEASGLIREKYDLPVIYMTAYADEETLARAKVTEPFAYIIKPFEERELRTAVVLASYRHRMNRALRDREQLLTHVMEAMHSAILVTDPAGTVRYASSSATDIAGTDISPGSSVLAVVPEVLARELRDTVSGGVTTSSVIWERSREDQDTVWFEIRIHLLPPEFTGAVWVLTDITDRLNRERALREQEEQLAYSRRMEAVGRMSGGLAHDFNNLVTVILGYARLALEDMGEITEFADLRENVQGLYDAAQRSAELTRRLLTVSRVSAKARSSFSPDDLVRETLPMISGLLPENIHLQTTASAGAVLLSADKRGMQQVLINLILNARDAMPLGGIIYLTTETVEVDEPLATFSRTLEPGLYVLVSVTDTGEGISPEHIPHVFEPFFTTKDEMHGSGFGLATVYSVISDADGAVHVSSTMGHGTRFSLYIPVAEDTRQKPAGEPRPAVEESMRGSGTVLVVDEENGVRSTIVRALRSAGYNPVAARSVGEGLLLLDHFRGCELIITDLSAPYHTTSEIVNLYRKTIPQAKVILMIGGEPVEAGQNGTLLKPFEPRELLETLRRLNGNGSA
jgi:two-component system, cell cycle sensor histidine kinase and response regulator CckA